MSLPLEKRSEFGIRLGAYLIDVVFAAILALILALALGSVLAGVGANAAPELLDNMPTEGMTRQQAEDMERAREAFASAGGAAGGFLTGFILAIPIAIFGYGLIEAFSGASLGKRVLKLKIANQDGTAGNTGLWIKRYLVKNAGSLVSLLGLIAGVSFLDTIGSILSLIIFIGCFFVLAAKRQAFHDMIAKTAVFKVADLNNPQAETL